MRRTRFQGTGFYAATLRRAAILLGGVGLFAAAAYASHAVSVDAADVAVTAPATRGDIEDIVASTGRIQPRAYVDVGAQASGQLRHLSVRIGDSVQAGRRLAEIDPQMQSAKVEADEAELARLNAMLAEQQAMAEFATAQLGRYTQLRPQNAVSKSSFDESRRDARTSAAKVDAIRAQIRQMQSTLKADEAALGYTRIDAPMTGTVVSIDAREGQTLNAAYSAPAILRIADLSTMTVWTQVSEADVTRLKQGMDVYFTTLGHGDRRWRAKLRQILPAPLKPEQQPGGQGSPTAPSPAASNNVVLYMALFDVDNAEGELRPEMTAQVFFVVAAAKDVLTIPIAAVKAGPAEGESVVAVETAPGSIESRKVRIGLRTRFTAEVVDGLREGERVVTGARKPSAKSSLVSFRL